MLPMLQATLQAVLEPDEDPETVAAVAAATAQVQQNPFIQAFMAEFNGGGFAGARGETAAMGMLKSLKDAGQYPQEIWDHLQAHMDPRFSGML